VHGVGDVRFVTTGIELMVQQSPPRRRRRPLLRRRRRRLRPRR
jgi:hypothetical protein